MPGPRVTLVVPCFNEARRIDVDAFARHRDERGEDALLFVDDGSTDGTADLLRARALPVLSLDRNRGKAEAVRRGVLRALESGPERFGYWDADLATPLDALADFERVLADNPELEIAMGARVRVLGHAIERRPTRHYLGRVFATAASRLLRLQVYDTQCGAKVFRNTPRTAGLFAEPFLSRWIFDVELLDRYARALGTREPAVFERHVREIPLRRWRDVGESKVRPHQMVGALRDLWRIRARSRRLARGSPVTSASRPRAP